MKIIITGASSYVGSSIYTKLKNKYDVIGTYFTSKLFSELELLDIRNKTNVENFVGEARPDIIIHVAANASGSWCEKNPEEALAINLEGTKNIVDAANKFNTQVIFISSMAIANTQSLYGKTKVEGEKYVQNVKNGYVILRPSLIIGFSPNTINDRPFNRIVRNITEQVPPVYDTSWNFQPTWLKHMVEVINIIIERNILNKVITVCVPEMKTRYEIAKDILSEFNITAIPEDKKDPTPTFCDDLKKLKELNLPAYTYNQMVEGIKEEIKTYLKTR